MLTLLLVSQPASAQNIFQTVRDLKSTVKQLTKPKSSVAPSVTTASTTAPQDADAGDEAGDLVSFSALASDPSDSQLELAAIRPGDPMSFDVLGLKLGMSPREVRRVSKKKKIKRGVGYPDQSGDFELEATKKANSTLSKKVSDSSKWQWRGGYAKPANGAYMHISTILTPRGPKVSDVIYTPSMEGQTQEEFLAALKQKYGQPTRSAGTGMWRYALWCTPGAKKCEEYSDKPVLHVAYSDRDVKMKLFMGMDAEKAAEAAIEQRAVQIRSNTGRKVAF